MRVTFLFRTCSSEQERAWARAASLFRAGSRAQSNRCDRRDRDGTTDGRLCVVMHEQRGKSGVRPRASALLAAGRRAALVGLILVLATLTPASELVQAQADTFAVGTLIRVVTSDGQPLDMRAGPAVGAALVTRLASGETVTVIAEPQSDGVSRWI